MGDFIDKHERGDDWWANLCKKHEATNHWEKKTPTKKKAVKKKVVKKKSAKKKK
tara:strand:- start:690 stop:851 length:162 start_codon:yes stop_codon:yes gene_type:complete